jgi:hypothetical protein
LAYCVSLINDAGMSKILHVDIGAFCFGRGEVVTPIMIMQVKNLFSSVICIYPMS